MKGSGDGTSGVPGVPDPANPSVLRPEGGVEGALAWCRLAMPSSWKLLKTSKRDHAMGVLSRTFACMVCWETWRALSCARSCVRIASETAMVVVRGQDGNRAATATEPS